MTKALNSLADVAPAFDAIVLDQWGVLHDGSTPYPGAVAALKTLSSAGHRLAVLSNSGKRAAPNAARIASIMGLPTKIFASVMTSGEALWQDLAERRVRETHFFPIERVQGDAAVWAQGLGITLAETVETAEAILLMGLPDGQDGSAWTRVLDHALDAKKVVYCSNPDRQSPRHGGQMVVSPGALAHAHADRGGQVVFYGKPHRPIFEALEVALGTQKLLMVGDSLEHDIAGGANAGWHTALIEGGLYAADFAAGNKDDALNRLMSEKSAPAPDYRLEWLQ